MTIQEAIAQDKFYVLDPWTAGLNVGLVSYYKFDESSGQAIDSLGLYNSSANTGAQGYPGKINTSYLYSGVNTNNTDFATVYGLGTTDVTINLWAYIDGTSKSGAFIHIGDWFVTGYGFGVGLNTYANGGNDLLGIYQGIRYLDTNTALSTGWIMATLVIHSDGVPEMYLNGSSLGNFTGTGTITPITESSIGGVGNDPQDHFFFAGAIDEVGIWNRSLTAAEVTQVYNGGDGITYTDVFDTCAYSSGDWNINCNDNCSIESPVNLGGNDLVFSGSGLFWIRADITNYGSLNLSNSCDMVFEAGAFLNSS